MNVWLCPIKPKSWRTVKTFKVFGFPKQASKAVIEVKSNDLIIFHVLKPVNGIVAICKVASEVYENHADIWGKNRYPLRVKIRFIPNFIRNENAAIPINLLFYKAEDSGEIRLEPYFKNVWIAKITQKQFKRLKALFKNKHARVEAKLKPYLSETTIPRFQEAHEYFKNGLSAKEIAHRMGVSLSTVYAYIRFGKDPQKYYSKIERRKKRRKSNKLKRRGTVFLKDIESSLRNLGR